MKPDPTIHTKLGEISSSLTYQLGKIEEICDSVKLQNGRVKKLEVSEWWWKGVVGTLGLALTISGFFLRDDINYMFHAYTNHVMLIESVRRLESGERQIVMEMHKKDPSFILEDPPASQ